MMIPPTGRQMLISLYSVALCEGIVSVDISGEVVRMRVIFGPGGGSYVVQTARPEIGILQQPIPGLRKSV